MTRRHLVVFSLEAWDGIWRRNQYLIDGLLRRDPELQVVFVEPSRDLLHDLLSQRLPKRGAGRRRADDYGGRLVLLQPTKWLPRLLGPLADSLLHRAVRTALRHSGATDPLLWVNDPGWAGFVENARSPALYDMTDDWLAAERRSREHERLTANEEILLRRCASVVVCSTGLFESRRAVRPDVVLIPNAVDVERYLKPVPRPGDLPDAPVAMYVGTLHEDRLDVELVTRTARALHERGAWFVLLGPNSLSAENSAVLHRTPGLLMLGGRDYATIPGYLQHADTLLVPHVVDAFTASLDPLKLYEYRVVGRPIVSTPVAGFRELQDSLVIIAEANGFPDAVVRTIQHPPVTTARVDVPDWSVRVLAMSQQLDRLG